MKLQQVIVLLLLTLAFGILYGCGEKDPDDETNAAPVIGSLTANPPSGLVNLGETSTLTAAATDGDGDVLTYTWDCTDGNLDTLHGNTVVWTAPDEANQSEVIVTVSDGIASVVDVYSFDFSSYAPGAPDIDSVHATPAHIWSVTSANANQWYMELFAKVMPVSGSGIIRVTAEMPNGTILNLRDDGTAPDIIPNDDNWQSFPGGYTLIVDSGWVNFTAVNQYYEEAYDSFLVDILCDTLPTMNAPDSTVGEIYCYSGGSPEFSWEPYNGADSYQIWITRYVSDPNVTPPVIWQPAGILTDTVTVYNFDNSASLIQLELYTGTQDYIFNLRVNKGNSWAKREQIIRRVN